MTESEYAAHVDREITEGLRRMVDLADADLRAMEDEGPAQEDGLLSGAAIAGIASLGSICFGLVSRIDVSLEALAIGCGVLSLPVSVAGLLATLALGLRRTGAPAEVEQRSDSAAS